MVPFPKVSPQTHSEHRNTHVHIDRHTQRERERELGKWASLIEKNQAERNLIAAVWPEGGGKKNRRWAIEKWERWGETRRHRGRKRAERQDAGGEHKLSDWQLSGDDGDTSYWLSVRCQCQPALYDLLIRRIKVCLFFEIQFHHQSSEQHQLNSVPRFCFLRWRQNY